MAGKKKNEDFLTLCPAGQAEGDDKEAP